MKKASFGVGLAAIALLTATPMAQHLWPSVVAWASEIRTYGSNGQDGSSGRAGASGTPGRPQSIRADGTPQQVFANGSDGRDGEDGREGERPYCPSQPRNVRYDLQAPNGGNGGNGGPGGNGGLGGDVTIYYTDAAHLRLVFVDAQGGQPGRGGRGGWGGDGCRCDDRDWEVQVCSGGTCRNERYVCQDGYSGRSGYDGNAGAVGQLGKVWLVNQETPLPGDAPTQTLPLESLLRQPVPLSKNIWETRRGAGALLASGSIVADEYNQYIGRVEAQAQVVWQAERSPTNFLSLSPTITLEDTGNVQLAFPESLWVAGQSARNGNLTTYTVTGVVRAEDATQLSWGNRSGYGQDLTATVIDLAQESAYLNTQFELTYRVAENDPRDDRRVTYSTEFEGTLPPELVTQDNDRFVLALGKLPVSDRYFQRGTNVQVELRIGRSLGSNSAVQTLEWEGQL